MKKILFLTSTPTIGGNGDALIEAAMAEAEKLGAEAARIDIRERKINFCRACYGCSDTGVCVQQDDFMEILHLAHEADAIIAEAPIYYNCMAAQMLTVVNRLCCTFACKSYQIGPKKKVGIFLTCTGSDVDEMNRHVSNILTLPSVSRAITEYRTEVFTKCISGSTCNDTPEYLARAKEVARWAVETGKSVAS
ncbi:MAG: flavodoxin family protein [Acetatifactor sp.]|nr:flavodoxin family protein [Acetatifactor sp.]